MLFVLLFEVTIFFLVGISINKDNASYLLSGYNTMSEAKRANYDLEGYLYFHRRFCKFLSISTLILGLLCYFININYLGIILAPYPIAAFLFFIWKTQKFNKNKRTYHDYLTYIFLAGILVFIMGSFLDGLKETEIKFHPDSIEFTGQYGEEIPLDSIREINRVTQLPEIRLRSNGLAMGNIKKGLFKTKGGEKVKLFVSGSEDNAIIEIIKNDGQKIYFSGKTPSINQTYQQLNEALLD